jgi:hypothetical protein
VSVSSDPFPTPSTVFRFLLPFPSYCSDSPLFLAYTYSGMENGLMFYVSCWVFSSDFTCMAKGACS